MNYRYIAGVIFLAIVAMFLVFTALMTHPFGDPNTMDGENIDTE